MCWERYDERELQLRKPEEEPRVWKVEKEPEPRDAEREETDEKELVTTV